MSPKIEFLMMSSSSWIGIHPGCIVRVSGLKFMHFDGIKYSNKAHVFLSFIVKMRA